MKTLFVAGRSTERYTGMAEIARPTSCKPDC